MADAQSGAIPLRLPRVLPDGAASSAAIFSSSQRWSAAPSSPASSWRWDFASQETRRNLETVHRQMAELAALRIRNYIEDVAQSVLRLAGAAAAHGERPH